MFKWLGALVDSNEKQIRKLQSVVDQINAVEPEFQKLADAELRAKTDQFKARLKEGEALDDILPEAFAAVREAARRTIGQRHFDVQLMGGMVLHQGKIAEMKTGEGKTLVATLPLYLNSLTGEGCHLVTLNDYLAKRDPHWMGPIYRMLGVSVASIQHESSYLYDPAYAADDPKWNKMRPITRRQAYEADITYGTNHEFGFDYLRDNMVIDLSQAVERPLSYAIVDEVDNILIDEARTPLIISGEAQEATNKYQIFARLVTRLKKDQDYQVDEKDRAVTLTQEGMSRMEEMIKEQGLLKAPNLYDPANYGLASYMDNALKAHALFRRDKDYVVKDGQVIIVDEFTGRMLFGRRYSEGLHQAIEAKEGVKVQRESLTLATVTLQNYFRMYKKLAGMTGTAATEAEEFHKIYKLDVVAIPTNKPMIRSDHPDQIYKSEDGKFKAVAKEIEALHKEGRPVLVGTVSIEKNEKLSDMLKRKGVPHQILNAKYHEKEAAIIAQAGRSGAVTVATNMAGRGVDILLGGNPERMALDDATKRGISLDGSADFQKLFEEMKQRCAEEHKKVVETGGLHIIGTERHEARRIDNQLRGRAGRQGDPGSSRFFISLEDDIVKRFGGERIKSVMEWAGMDEETPIENAIVSKAIENAQIRTEGYNFDIRKHLVDFDDVVNKHREVIYAERKKILSGADLKANIFTQIREEIGKQAAAYFPDEPGAAPDAEALRQEMMSIMPMPSDFQMPQGKKEADGKLVELAESIYEQREKELGPENMRILERLVMLRTIDNLWVEHLTAMEQLRQGIGLQAYAQVDPLVAYKREGHAQFQALTAMIQHDVVHTIYKVGIARQGAPAPVPARVRTSQGQREVVVAGKGKVGRNDPCPCGSGLKYKKCHGKEG
ncbi:MAG: preprotein translocase subunit SecA [Chloroflexi bacterium]|nr:preprotein translocase subunit SecA [Chloroflexota bacterium]